jgi:hypothetical protein
MLILILILILSLSLSVCVCVVSDSETQNINKSLLSLGDVIHAALEQQQQPSTAITKHIPYRNSKLTYLLQDSLGGNSKTLMIVQASPNGSDVEETLSTLAFGQRVSQVKLKPASASAATSTSNESVAAVPSSSSSNVAGKAVHYKENQLPPSKPTMSAAVAGKVRSKPTAVSKRQPLTTSKRG